jgi:hypothetical protein
MLPVIIAHDPSGGEGVLITVRIRNSGSGGRETVTGRRWQRHIPVVTKRERSIPRLGFDYHLQKWKYNFTARSSSPLFAAPYVPLL